jgi:linoleoyl-CoA desaturase
MKTDKIKFSTHIKTDFISELRKEVYAYFEQNRISKSGNLSIVVKSVFMLTVYFLPYFLMIFGIIDSLIGMALCWITMGIGMAGVGMVLMHDANHGTFSSNRAINKILEKSLYLLGGFPLTWQIQHNTLHHGYTNIDGHDDDINPIGLLRFSPHKPLLKIQKYQYLYAWFLYGLMTFSWTMTKDFLQINKYKNVALNLNKNIVMWKLYIKLTVSKLIFYGVFIAIPILMLPVAWYWVVLLYLLMHFTSGFLLSIIFQTAHVVTTSKYPLPDENGNIDNNWAIHQLMTTSDYSPKSKIFSWCVGGLNYQIEHHLFPNICHIHYKKISVLVKKITEKYGLPYYVQPTFIAALTNHAKMLKILGR